MKPFTPAVFYATLLPALREVAKEHGYALCIHGSMTRDFDLVAVPWTDDAAPPLTLINAIKFYTQTCVHWFEHDHHWPDGDPTTKPHGRLAYSLHFTDQGADGPYLDISVLPKSDRMKDAVLAFFESQML